MTTPTSAARPVGLYADGAPAANGRVATDVRMLDHNGLGVPQNSYGYNDGAPPARMSPRVRGAGSGDGAVKAVTKFATRIRSFEGLRGYSTRMTVAVKHASWLLSIIICVAACKWAFSDNPTWYFGGEVMLYSITFMLVVAAIGSVLYADSRNQIYDQTRHFVFGIVMMPGTALALFMRLVNAALNAPAANDDMFASILRGHGLPLVYFSLTVIPAFVLAKYVFGGVRSLNRQAMADEEQMASIMRQDGHQR